jgi:hypothetical protein
MKTWLPVLLWMVGCHDVSVVPDAGTPLVDAGVVDGAVDDCLPETVDSSNDGDPGAVNRLALVEGAPEIAYQVTRVSGVRELRLARRTDQGWQRETLEAADDAGLAAHLDVVSEDGLWIAASGAGGDVLLLHRAPGASTFSRQVVSLGTLGVNGVALELVQGRPVVAVVSPWPEQRLMLWDGDAGLETIADGPVYGVDLAVTAAGQLWLAYGDGEAVVVGRREGAAWVWQRVPVAGLAQLALTVTVSSGIWLAVTQIGEGASVWLYRVSSSVDEPVRGAANLQVLGFAGGHAYVPELIVRRAYDQGGVGRLPPTGDIEWVTPAFVTAASAAIDDDEVVHHALYATFGQVLGYLRSDCGDRSRER